MKTYSGPVTCLAFKARTCQALLIAFRETMEKLIDIEELSEILGVTKATIYSWTSQNRIPHIKLSKRLLKFSEEEIKAWIAERSISMDTARPVERERKRPALTFGHPRDEYIERIIRNAKKDSLN